MIKHLKQTNYKGNFDINISGSKSESNRLLILKKIYPELEITNLSTADDTVVMQKALQSTSDTIDIHHAGTAMRFLTAYFALNTQKTICITGSERMQNRPIKVLVDALLSLGAKVSYKAKQGYPPLHIHPSVLTHNHVELQANISSQYISALMLSAPGLSDGLSIDFKSEVTSLPYIVMTVELMRTLGIKIDFDGKSLKVFPANKLSSYKIEVESDWSSASYFYSLVALSPGLKISLSTLKKNSLQGDAKLSEIYKKLGVKTTFLENKITLENVGISKINSFKTAENALVLNLNDTPDLAQTIAITCLGLNMHCKFTGLHTLKIKETDRLVALKTEIEKFGAKVKIDEDSLALEPVENLKAGQNIETYNDHRMAMAFAPLSAKTSLTINDADVVSKSYPDFWIDLESLMP